jgi:hypothetical protein
MSPEMNSVSSTLPVVPQGSSAPSAAMSLVRSCLSFRVLLAVGLALMTVCTVSNRFNDPDMWWHLKAGEIVWNTHAAPSTDLFSFTVFGRESTEHEWLAQLSIYAAYRLGGYPGMMLWLMILASVLFLLVYVLCYLVTRNALVSLFGGVCAWFFGTVSLAIRPLIPGNICFVAELILLHLATRNRRWLWLLPPLFVVWVNCHGSYFFGLGVLGASWLSAFAQGKWGFLVAEPQDGTTRRSLGLILLACALALCCNPVGAHVFLYPLTVLFHQSTSMNAIDEWLPLDPSSPRGAGLILVAMGILLLCSLRKSELYLREVMVVLPAFVLALMHSRMTFVFGIAVSPVLCRLVSPYLEERRKREQPVLNAMMIGIFAGVMFWVWPGAAGIQQQIRNANPAGAVEFIQRQALPGPMLNDYGFGGYLIWSLPQQKVFIDGRGDLYDPAGILAEYGRWATVAEDPNLLLNKYHIRLCLLSKSAPMAHVLPHLPGWRTAYSDDLAIIFARSAPDAH